ncbi:hypothetical protein H8356DRAFT_1339713 [Neocallimastix lanati (nom. inval.)]|nr:hypothetical protein H8356DRAFT_1339713 [Neocallimastix sp. JGI-2020a]
MLSEGNRVLAIPTEKLDRHVLQINNTLNVSYLENKDGKQQKVWEALKYESLHNHLEKEIDVSISVAKHKIKEEIKKNSIPMDINLNIYLMPNENFMIFKNPDLIIFQSPFQAYLFSNYHKNIFADGTFYAAPKFSYQLFITRTYVGEFNMSNTLITTINFHCDFEQGISNVAKKIIRKTKNILCYHEVKNNNDYNVNNWNYYENIERLTNNASESYNSYLNNIFPNKPLFYKLIYILKEEENLSYNDYQRRTKGNWKKSKKYLEINLFYNGYNRNELVKLWEECLIDLNDININLK